MALYQYFLAVVPVKGILRVHSEIPTTIRVSTKSEYFESDVEIYWNEVKEDVSGYVSQIDSVVDRANWGNTKTSFNWKTFSTKIDNDAAIFLNEETLNIEEFSFRADLRDENLKFLKNMIELGQQNNWLFMDREGMLLGPDFEVIKESIKKSNAFKFLKDPEGYLDSLG